MRRLHLVFDTSTPFCRSHTVSMQASARRCEMSLGVLKWYGSLITALFKLVGSRQIYNLTCLWLSFFSTRTKLLIHGVASVTGSRTLACSIWLISFWNMHLWDGSVWVCRGFVLASLLDQPGYDMAGPRNFPMPSKTSGYSCKICFLIGDKCRWFWFVALDVVVLNHLFLLLLHVFELGLVFLFFLDGLPCWLLSWLLVAGNLIWV